MKGFRFVRGVVGVGVVWGVAWAAVLGVASAAFWLIVMRPYASLSHSSLPVAVIHAAIRGFILGVSAGVMFSCVLAVLERRRTFGTLLMWRVAGWGAVAGVALLALVVVPQAASLQSASMAEVVFATVLIGGLAAVSAAATLGAARRGRLQADEDPGFLDGRKELTRIKASTAETS